ncbi:hypothetical protein Hanom_Chr09g00779931 [Helianthus anomalus]
MLYMIYEEYSEMKAFQLNIIQGTFDGDTREETRVIGTFGLVFDEILVCTICIILAFEYAQSKSLRKLMCIPLELYLWTLLQDGKQRI